MINKKTFKPFRLEELNGGINVLNSPEEIQDKQAVFIKNWNFKGNRLVSEKGFSNSGNNNRSEIGSLTIDSGDIWTISQGNIIKNGVVLPKGNGISISVNSDNFRNGHEYSIIIDGTQYDIVAQSISELLSTLYGELNSSIYDRYLQDDLLTIKRINNANIVYSLPNVQSLILYNFDDVTQYQDGITYNYFFNIGGTEYSGSYTMSSPGLNAGQVDVELMTQIKDQLPASYHAEVVNLDSNQNIIDDYVASAGVLLKTGDTFSTVTKTLTLYRIRGYNKFSGTQVDSYLNNSQLSIDGNTIDMDFCRKLDFGPGNSGGVLTNDVLNIDGVSYTYNGTFYATQASDNVFGPMITALQATGNYYTHLYYDGRYSLIVARKDGRDMVATFNGITITSGGSGSSYNPDETSGSYQPFSSWNTSNGRLYNGSSDRLQRDENTRRDRILEEINALPGYTAREGLEYGGTLGIYFWKDDFSDTANLVNTDTDFISIVQFSTNSQGGFNFDKTSVDIRGSRISDIEFNVSELSYNSALNNGRSNIVIGNNGTLVIDKDLGGASYYYNGILASIGNDSVGEPTVGTIYNGKIILGGYEDNDNIVFSKTSSPTFPLSLLNFTDYSAGGQSVSGGDKGLVTGMMVGENGLYVFKDNSVWYSNSEKDDPNSSSFNLIFNKITSNGALTQNVITEVDQDIFYLDWKNRAVRRLGYEQNLTTLRDDSISKEIAELLEELPEEQPLATSHFKYPNYQLSLNDGQGSQVEYNNGNSYKLNNKHFIYNVDNKSWTTRDGIDNLIISDEGHFVASDGNVYIDFDGNTSSPGEFLSKHYVFGDDIMMKKFGRFEIIGNVKGSSSNSKTLTLTIYIDGEETDVREFTAGSNESIQIREKIDLYDIGQKIQFKLEHSGIGEAEVHDIQVYYKGTSIQPQDYN